jgi:hypothetical protein
VALSGVYAGAPVVEGPNVGRGERTYAGAGAGAGARTAGAGAGEGPVA